MDDTLKTALFEFSIQLADDRLILGHRLSEWCGHGPILEEDIALANIALDLIGQANMFLGFAASLEGKGRDADDLAYFRSEREFFNLKLCELPKGDFGFTVARMMLFSSFSVLLFDKLKESKDEELSGIAAKSLKESKYHLRHSSQWVIRLGDGTEESHQRVQDALNELWPYTGELFFQGAKEQDLVKASLVPDTSSLRESWSALVKKVITEATLDLPSDDQFMHSGGRTGAHTEHLGHLLAEMQILRRSYPDAKWD